MVYVKRTMLQLLATPGVTPALSSLTGSQAGIFMLHRFSVPDLGISGHDPQALRSNLAYLRKSGYALLSLEEMFRRLREGLPMKRAVAFTIDDGYFDHAEVAAPVFAEFDCPVTCFVTTGFLDRKVWFWWDRLTTVFESAQRKEIHGTLEGREFHYRWDSAAERKSACWNLNLKCQDASEAGRLACIDTLGRENEVALPFSPPPRFAPMSWDQARKLESRGVSFGPHTVTHPVLGTTSAEQAEREIVESWTRLKEEVANPVPVFCYPNGRSQDIGEREISTVKSLGLWGGVMAHPGEISRTEFYRAPRFGYTDDRLQLLQCLSGIENFKSHLRRKLGWKN